PLCDAVLRLPLSAARQPVTTVFPSVSFGQTFTVGASVSTTVTLNEHVAVLPAPSVAVYVTVVVPSGNTSPLLCELDNDTEQLSQSDEAAHVPTAPQELASVLTVISV